MELIDVIKRLTGPINPVGDSSIDSDRAANLIEMIKLSNQIIQEIHAVYFDNISSYEGSRIHAAKISKEYLDTLCRTCEYPSKEDCEVFFDAITNPRSPSNELKAMKDRTLPHVPQSDRSKTK